MLDGGLGASTRLPLAIVVGRTLSAATVSDVKDGQVILTYTAYNQEASPETGVLLTTTLAPGVSYSGSSQAPDRAGQNLAWSLGTIPAYGRVSVSVTVNLANASVLQLDTGATAFATVDGGSVSDTALAAALQDRVIAPALLSSTSDANTADPFVQEKAAELDYDPQKIFDYLHGEIGYHSYAGSLRGARGTLWSGAGNALDVASLGVALMRASGIPAQYVSGTLPDARAQSLIVSMFPAGTQTMGYLPAGATTADPANDPKLLSEARDHTWFQFDTGAGMTDADPLIGDATVGQSFTATTKTFSAVPSDLRVTTEISLDAEIFSQAQALFGTTGLSTSRVLDVSFNTTELAGKTISLGFLVDSKAIGALVFGALTTTYTPYLAVVDVGGTLDSAEIIRGEPFQETYTNFPLVSTALTGLSLGLDVGTPDGAVQHYDRIIADRVGFAARQNGGAVELGSGQAPAPLVTPYDFTTLLVAPGATSRVVEAYGARVAAALQQRLDQVQPSLRGVDPSSLTPEQEGAVEQSNNLVRNTLVETTRERVLEYALFSEASTRQLAASYMVAAYDDAPRLILTTTRLLDAASGSQPVVQFGIDQRRDSVRSVAAPGQSANAPFLFNVARGFVDNVAESLTFAPNDASGSDPKLQLPVNTPTIFQAALDQGVPVTVIAPGNASQVSGLEISPEAKARISQALSRGLVVLTPVQSVQLNGIPTIGWYEQDPVTGETTGVLEDGGHASEFIEEGFTYTEAFFNVNNGGSAILFLTGFIIGDFFQQMVLFRFPGMTPKEFADYKALQFRIVRDVIAAVAGGFIAQGDPGFGAGLFAGYSLGTEAAKRVIQQQTGVQDPPANTFLSDLDLPRIQQSNDASASVPVSASNPAGPVQGAVLGTAAQITGAIQTSWNSSTTNTFLVTSLSSPGASVVDARGQLLGTGPVSFSTAQGVGVSVRGSANYQVGGQGSLSFYHPIGGGLGASGSWDACTAAINGAAVLEITTDGLVLNGSALPAGTYTISASQFALAGAGPSSSPSFEGAVAINASVALVTLGPGSGSLNVGGTALDASGGIALGDYSGAVMVTSGPATHTIAFHGSSTSVLRVSAVGPASADQNSRQAIPIKLQSSLAGAMELTAQAPANWTVAFDAGGTLLVTAAPGLQGGTYPVQVVARSTTDPRLVVQTTIPVLVTPTSPGVTINAAQDPLYTISYQGAEVPTAFRVEAHNDGPTADTFSLSIPDMPAGFEVLVSRSSITIPAGETAIAYFYLRPTSEILAPGTDVTFHVAAASISHPTITASQRIDFKMPVVHAVTLSGTPFDVASAPGVPVTQTITIRNAGNTTEVVTITQTASAKLKLSSLGGVTLAPGESMTQTLTLTPDPLTPLNTVLLANVVATFGPSGPALTQSLNVPVSVVVPGAAAIRSASTAARSVGNPGLADRLDDLSRSLTSLVQSPADPVAKSQSLASLDAVIGLLEADAGFADSVAALRADRAVLESAALTQQIRQAVAALGNDLDAAASILADRAAHGLALGLVTNSAVIQPQAPVSFQLVLQNTGSQATTYDLSVTGLPPGVTASFSQDSIVLQPSQGSPGTVGVPVLMLTLTSTSATELTAFSFRVVATAHEAPLVSAAVVGSLSTRNEFVSVASVTADPPFTNPGGPVEVSARILNAVNQVRDALAGYVLKDSGGDVVFTSTPVPFTLSVLTTLTPVDLGPLDTTGLARGTYTILVTVTSSDGAPVPGGEGTGSLLVGSPVSGTLTLDQETLPAGTGTVTTTLQIQSQTTLIGPLGLVSQTDLAGAGGVAKSGQYVYASGSGGIGIFDVSDPSTPSLVRTFGYSSTQLEVRGNRLYALTRGGFSDRFNLRIYSLADPASPQLLGSAKYTDGQEGIPYSLAWHMVVTETHVYVSLWGFTYLIGGQNDIKYQVGDLISIDTSDPTAPVFVSALKNTYGTFNDGIGRFLNVDVTGGDGPEWEVRQLDANTLLMAGSTVHGDNTQDGQGVVQVVDISDPAHMSIVKSLVIPGTVQTVGLSIDGDRALVTGSTTGWEDLGSLDFTGDTVLAVLDVSDHRNPMILGQQTLGRSARGPADLYTTALGNDVFVFSSRYEPTATENPALFVVDASDPQNLGIQSTAIPAFTADVDGQGNYVYAIGNSGLLIYQIQASAAILVTARVEVPNGTGVSIVPGSFSVPPTQTIPGADFDTLVFQFPLTSGSPSQTITWRSTITDLGAGERRRVVDGATLDFNSQGTDGKAGLAPLDVVGEQILHLDPGTQTARPGEAADYRLFLNNPTGQELTYAVSIQGVPESWSDLPATITVAAGTTSEIPFTLRSDVFTPVGDFGFTVLAVAGGVSGSVGGGLVLTGVPKPVDADSHGVLVTLTPASASAGQGTMAVFTARIFNTGSAVETYTLSAILPPDIAVEFAETTVTVSPGAANFRDVRFTLTPGAGTSAGPIAFSLIATSTGDAAVTNSAGGTLNVLRGGVSVVLNPPSGAPGSLYEATVTNTGDTADTFDLALGGPAALVSTLGVSQVTLAPGASRVIPISTGGVNFALPGMLPLIAMATSQSNAAVRDGASAGLAIPSIASMTAALSPSSVSLSVPGPASFAIRVNNTGNAADRYSAEIVGTSGPITARLIGLDDQPTTTIPLFRLPALAEGVLSLRIQITGAGSGNVVLRITSLTTGQVTTLTAQVEAVDAQPDGPKVVLVQRYGIHMMPTRLVLTFDEPLDPVKARDVRAYQVRDAHGRLMLIRRVVHDPVTNTVTLYPAQRLDLHRRYELTVDGASPRALTDTQGRRLDGNADGLPGGNYAASITWRNAVLPRNWKRAERSRAPLVRPLRPQHVVRARIGGASSFSTARAKWLRDSQTAH